MMVMMTSAFTKGDHVEVIKRTTSTTTTYYTAVVLRTPTRSKVQVEYLTLITIIPRSPNPTRVRERVQLTDVRPLPPPPTNGSLLLYGVGMCVDVYTDNGWWKAKVRDVWDNGSRFVVEFDGQRSECVVVQQCSLRPHRDWLPSSSSASAAAAAHPNWVPPPVLPPSPSSPDSLIKKRSSSTLDCLSTEDCSSTVETNPRKVRVRIKCGGKEPEPVFVKGTKVEVKSDEEGYVGAWFEATILTSIGSEEYLVGYLNLLTDDGTSPLREVANVKNIRPCPPSLPPVDYFKPFEKVDAWYNEGWWEGAVSCVLKGFKYMVYFSTTNEHLVFQHSDLRPRQEWINGNWVEGKTPLDIDDDKKAPMAPLCRGTEVEVRTDEEGFEGAWLPATIIDVMKNEEFLVQYKTLMTEDGTDFLQEVASASNLRPVPPRVEPVNTFFPCDIVDAWYNEIWWVGRIIRVHQSLNYTVHFKTNEEIEFDHHSLRPHQEWVDGNWVPVNQDWEF